MPDAAPSVRNAPLVLIIRDGWGRNPNPEHHEFNAIELASTPVDDRLSKVWPTTLIRTSGEDVGLPDGTMGNSEVGHQNIGAGRVVDQESVRITKACREGLSGNPVLSDAVGRARDTGRYVHLMGIASDAGVHGLLEHLFALVDLCADAGQEKVAVHLFTDGRDTGPFTGAQYVQRVQDKLDASGVGVIASIAGRYWAMDRDNRWERVERAYRCLTGRGARRSGLPLAPTGVDAVRRYYDEPESDSMRGDEFITPTMIGRDLDDALSTRITHGDTVIYYNYRGDRPRELMAALVEPEFEGSDRVKPSPDTGRRGFDRGERLDLHAAIMTAYSERLAGLCEVAFPKPPKMRDIAGEYLSGLGLAQFRCAETEKFPHVTFFFNDYRDEPFEGERREIIQSPKVSTYDQQPEMSAAGVRDAVLARLDPDDPEPFIVVNFANGDMVGHTGNLQAAIRACECVDSCVGAIVDRVLELGGSAIVTADHGNAEQMWSPENDSPHTAHTVYDVPLIVVGEAFRGRTPAADGRLADVVPTALDMLGIERPEAMTGRSLLR